MRSIISVISVLAMVALTAGCDEGANSGGDKGAGTGKATTTAAADAKPMTDAELEKAEIPVPEDFEDDAEKEITEDNLDDELAKLEKEISE
jgi:hypothetical protein